MKCKSLKLILALYVCAGSVVGQYHIPPYPETKQTTAIDDYYGIKVTDNYRWLENMDDQGVKDWFKTQGDFTSVILEKITGRNELLAEFLRLDSMRSMSIFSIIRQKDRYFYLKELAGENVFKLYYRDGKNGEEIMLFDPGTYEASKTYTISYINPSRSGKLIAIGLALAGAEQARILIMDVDNTKLFPESIYPSWFGVSDWTDDDNFFIYTKQKSSELNSKDLLLNTMVMMHSPGTDPSNDPIIFSRELYPDLGIVPEDLLFLGISEDRKFIVSTLGGVQSEQTCFIAPVSELKSKRIGWKSLFKKEDKVTSFVFANDSIFFLTYKDASNSRVLVTSSSNPDISNARVVIPEGNEHIRYISRSKDYLFAAISNGISQHVLKYSFSKGNVSKVTSPAQGIVDIEPFDVYENDCIMSISGWTMTSTRYEYNAETETTSLSSFNTSIKYPGTDDLVVKEVEAESYDGTMVPLSIIMDKNTKLDGNSCCYLTGYGSYGSSSNPRFSFIWLSLIKKAGIIVAVAHVRGGGEKGEEWHLAGFKQTKQNTWKDFIACAEFLEKNHYTSSSRLFGEGTSAGGILIGRAITERPDLFAAAICNVGVANVLRAEESPNGPNNTREFGTIKDESECKALIEMDALGHVKDGTRYPAVLCCTGINDPRVAPWQPGKFAAALQHSTSSNKPVLLRVDYNSGHFSGEKIVTYNFLADMFSFGLWQSGHKDFQIK